MDGVCLFPSPPLEVGVEQRGGRWLASSLCSTHSVSLWLYVHLKCSAHSVVTVRHIIVIPAVGGGGGGIDNT